MMVAFCKVIARQQAATDNGEPSHSQSCLFLPITQSCIVHSKQNWLWLWWIKNDATMIFPLFFSHNYAIRYDMQAIHSFTPNIYHIHWITQSPAMSFCFILIENLKSKLFSSIDLNRKNTRIELSVINTCCFCVCSVVLFFVHPKIEMLWKCDGIGKYFFTIQIECINEQNVFAFVIVPKINYLECKIGARNSCSHAIGCENNLLIIMIIVVVCTM